MPRNTLPFEATIANPCQESWAAMHGGARERNCQLCDKQVHNFAAMTPREIEKLVLKSNRRLCARITRREDGSLVTLEAQPRASIAAQVAVSASLALSAVAGAAQTVSERPVPHEKSTSTFIGTVEISADSSSLDPIPDEIHVQIEGIPPEATPDAALTGRVMGLDGKDGEAGATISLIADSRIVATTKAVPQGNFRIVAPPGNYDVVVRTGPMYGVQVTAANLHAGEQSIPAIKTHFWMADYEGNPTGGQALMGVVAGVEQYTFSSAVRHPWSYLKHLARKL